MWKKSKRFAGYEVSDTGKVRPIKIGGKTKPLKKRKTRQGNTVIVSPMFGNKQAVKVGKMVADAFLEGYIYPTPLTYVDGNVYNDSLENLVVDDAYNFAYKIINESKLTKSEFIRKAVDIFDRYLIDNYGYVNADGKITLGNINEDDENVKRFRSLQNVLVF